MGYLYRPKMKDSNVPMEHRGVRCTHERHGHEDICTGCGARFGKVWWMKYYDAGRPT
jgi:hypothetical protein